MAEQLKQNNTKIAYIVSSGSSFRKIYYTAKSTSNIQIRTTTNQYFGTYIADDDTSAGVLEGMSGTYSSTSPYEDGGYDGGSECYTVGNDNNPLLNTMYEQNGHEWEGNLPNEQYYITAHTTQSQTTTTTSYTQSTCKTNQLYVLKSYSESNVYYSISAFKTYNVTKSLPATVYVVDTARRVITYSTRSTPGSGYTSSRSGAVTMLNTFRTSATKTYSVVLQSYIQIGSPAYSSSTRSTGFTTYSFRTETIPVSVAVTSLPTTTSTLMNWKNIKEAVAPITPDISSRSATFTSLSNGRTYYTTDNYITTFDAEFYGSAYPDVAVAYSSKTSAYSSHWTRYGYSEVRIANSKGFFVLSTSFGGFTTTTSGFPKRIAIQRNSNSPVSYYSKITSETQLRRFTVTTHNNYLEIITTVWKASESIVSQYTDSMTSTMDISSRTY